jgi:hypothetical protein
MINPLGKLTLLGVAASAAVMAMASDEDLGAASEGNSKIRQASMAVPRALEPSKPMLAGATLEFERVLRRKQHADGRRKIGNAFNATSWYVPPPPPPALPPPAPTAPPLPFAYLGQYKPEGSSITVIFLSSADKVYSVSEGDVIDGTYSVGRVTAGQLELTYLPLNVKQSLTTGGVL